MRNAPQIVQNVVTYDVVVGVDNADLVLKPGMTANISIVSAHRENVLKVPLAALRFRPPAQKGSEGGTDARNPQCEVLRMDKIHDAGSGCKQKINNSDLSSCRLASMMNNLLNFLTVLLPKAPLWSPR